MDFNFLIRFLPLINPFLIFAGWWFIRKNAKVFAARAEANSIAKDIQKVTDDIKDVSQKFWLSKQFDIEYPYPAIVMSAFKRLATKIKIFQNYGLKIDNSKFIRYRRSLTLEVRNNETKKDACQETYARILDETTELNNHIDKLISGRNIEKNMALHIKHPDLMGGIFGLSIVFNYLFVMSLLV